MAEAAFDPNAFKAYKLLKVEKLTHNTNLYRRDPATPTWAPKHPSPQQSRPPARSFATPLPEQTADLPVASCLVTKRGPAACSPLAARLRPQGPPPPPAEPGARAGRPSGRAASR